MWGPKQNKSITVRRPACEIGLSSRARRRLQQSDPLPTKRLHNRRQRLNPLAKPGQLLLGNPVMLRIASLDVRLLQLLEARTIRSEEHTSELQSLMRISYAVFCLKKKKKQKQHE